MRKTVTVHKDNLKDYKSQKVGTKVKILEEKDLWESVELSLELDTTA
mgnify:CR=1 FL=1